MARRAVNVCEEWKLDAWLGMFSAVPPTVRIVSACSLWVWVRLRSAAGVTVRDMRHMVSLGVSLFVSRCAVDGVCCG